MVHLRTWKRNSDVFGLACNSLGGPLRFVPSRRSTQTMSFRTHIPGLLSSPRRLICQQRPFSTSTSRSDFHFDTHHFVQRLEREGLNRAQAEGIMSAMAEVIDESIRNMTSNMVTKAEQEKARLFYQYTHIPPLRTLFSITIHNKLTLHR